MLLPPTNLNVHAHTENTVWFTRLGRGRVDMSSTCSSYSVASTSSDQEIDSDTSGSSDLDDLYNSFDFEDNTTAVATVLQLVSVHLPVNSSVPTSVHKLKKVILECFPDSRTTSYFYCDFCHRPLLSATNLHLG